MFGATGQFWDGQVHLIILIEIVENAIQPTKVNLFNIIQALLVISNSILEKQTTTEQ